MDKFIGFDIDHKHTVACVVQAGQPDHYRKLRNDTSKPKQLRSEQDHEAHCCRQEIQKLRRTYLACGTR